MRSTREPTLTVGRARKAGANVLVRELRNVTQDLLLGHVGGQGTPIPINDVWIAACAMEHGLPVATNDRHFLSVSQIMVFMVAEQEM